MHFRAPPAAENRSKPKIRHQLLVRNEMSIAHRFSTTNRKVCLRFIRPTLMYSVFIALTILAISTANPSYSDENKEILLPLGAAEQKVAGIATTTIELETTGQILSFPGTVIVPPHQSSVVAAPATGMIESVLVTQDETVQKGQVIATLRSPQVVEAQQNYLAAQTDEKLASDKLRRAESLLKVKAMPEAQVELVRAEHTHAVARVEEKMQLLQLMGVSAASIDQLRNTRKIDNAIEIAAPKSGTVIERIVKQGTRVEAAAPLFTIATLNPLWVNIQVPTSRMSLMREGKIVALPAEGARGKVIRIGRTIDAPTQSIGVVAEIDTNAGSVRPGLITSVTVRIDSEAERSWLVPVAAVIRHRGRSWIFVQSAEGFRAAPVEVLSESGQKASIRGQLSNGDRVASQGVLMLAAELAEQDAR
jgi:RND family efflux transporter MFP subunit